MKIRRPWMIKLAALLGAWLVRIWIGTLRCRLKALGPEIWPNVPDLRQRYIYIFWHEALLLPAYHFGQPDIFVLISQHADGQIIAEICRRLGFSLARGSTTRGGVEAVRQMLRAGKGAHLALTPDGPRGPRREVQPGVIYLAARTGLPIAPIGISCRRAWRLRSWDKFALPRPWTSGIYVATPPIVVPPDVDKDGIEHYRQIVQESMLRATEMAEEWAQGEDAGKEEGGRRKEESEAMKDGEGKMGHVT
jgi:lysophospholipid acyltransferase (LPLAT)-like uncharacterized protein